jgi:hypothetical protein
VVAIGIGAIVDVDAGVGFMVTTVTPVREAMVVGTLALTVVFTAAFAVVLTAAFLVVIALICEVALTAAFEEVDFTTAFLVETGLGALLVVLAVTFEVVIGLGADGVVLTRILVLVFTGAFVVVLIAALAVVLIAALAVVLIAALGVMTGTGAAKVVLTAAADEDEAAKLIEMDTDLTTSWIV